ncbi:REP element-mobilizing transposase RayT OS=Streptomyces griseomycini OX=66895 GN=FHS37_007797 PE=4 SV=1 [Streptomyces griseomycini]|nr:hypothetical protein GCM10015536_76910 [Streptomyces griseomycini]
MNDEVLTRCEEIMHKVYEGFGAELKESNGKANHVHLPMHHPPKVTLTSLVNSLKGVPSRRLRAEFTGRVNRSIMHGRFWSPSYFVARAAAHRSRWSRTTSRSRSGRTEPDHPWTQADSGAVPTAEARAG